MSRFLILMYHMIREPGSTIERRYACPPVLFDRHMALLRAKGYAPVSLDAIEAYLSGNENLPERAVAVTLDDGLRDNYEHAFPVLQRHEIPATIFLATGLIGKTNAWMLDEGYPERPMLSWDQVREMRAAGVTFGGHGVSHPRLPGLAAENAMRELADSKAEIEQQIGEPVRHFAYPYGLFSAETQKLAQAAGYTLACSTRSGFNTRATDPFALRRIEVFGNDAPWKLAQKLVFGSNEAGALMPLRYYWGRAVARIRGS